jgi:hypothetical protein
MRAAALRAAAAPVGELVILFVDDDLDPRSVSRRRLAREL